MNTLDLFSLKIYKTKYDQIEEINNIFLNLTEVFQKTKNNNVQSMQDGTLCSYFTESNLQNISELTDFVKFAEHHANIYWKQLNYASTLSPKLIQVWANETPKFGWIRSHLHGSIPLTATLYVNAKPKMGNIVFENPIDSILISQPMDYNAQQNIHHELEVTTGDFVIFPGWLRHHVLPNQLEEKRLILGMHFGAVGSYCTENWITKA